VDPLATAETFAGYLQRDLDRYTAELALAGASGVVRSYCGWGISQTVEEWTRDGDGSRVLTLPTLRLTAVQAVTLDATGYSDWSDLVAPDDYQWSTDGMLVRRAGWPVGFRNINVRVEHGHQDIPDDVQLVTCSLASRYYVNPEGLRSKQIGGIGRTYLMEAAGRDLTELHTRLLDRYRLPW
jgi:hypothetical protein